MRIAIAALKQETNTFSPILTGLRDFERTCLYFDEDVVSELGLTATEVGGFLHVLTQKRVETIPTVAAWTLPSGRLRRRDFQALMSGIVDRLKMTPMLDGVLFSLHGALAVEGIDDGEGFLLNEVRKVLDRNVYIGCSLDCHANITKKMLAAADVLVGYKTYPHEDAFETGVQTAKILYECVVRKKTMKCYSVSLPLIVVPSENSQTSRGLMKDVMNRLRDLEEETGVVSCSCFFPHAWLDIQDFNVRLIAYTEANGPTVEKRLMSIAELLFRRKDEFTDGNVPLPEAFYRLRETKNLPVIWIDSGDIVLAGSPGDSTEVLKALYDYRRKIRSVLTVTDPEAIASLKERDVGEEVKMPIGGKISVDFHSPVLVEGHIRRKSDGGYRYSGPHMRGLRIETGTRIVIESDQLILVVTENPDSAHDPEFYSSLDVPLENMDVVVVKSHNTFKPAYEKVSKEYVRLRTTGVTEVDLASLKYERMPRPIFPLDSETRTSRSILQQSSVRQS